MVWAEVPVYWTISWTNPDTYANANAQLTDLVTRDKNRASVVVWSVGNETPIGGPLNTFMSNLA
jgi:beta-glucuronidase